MLFLANIFQPLIDIFEPALKFFHNSVGVSWGWSIVLLTVVIRALLLPLAFRQFHSMQKLQQAAPELKAIQAKYKDDKQRQQQEVMKFYRENEINPFASCLPLVAQLPVFIGLFYTLRTRLREDICPTVQHAFQANYAAAHHVSAHVAAGQTTYCSNAAYAHLYHGGAGFLFINDITATATGLTLVVLIILYVGTQLASTLMMSTPTMDPNQRRIMMLMPLFFVIFIINFPAGLIVYWITTNAWTMLQQYVIRRRVGPVVPVAPVEVKGTGKPPADGNAGSAPTTNGDGSGGLGGLLRGLSKQQDGSKETTGVATASRARRETPPPRPPRKKKKRSGRRR
jgi:YidC/Oxa1 family membrane protein insertase